MELVKAGADRQEMHERIRQHSMAAWEAVQRDPAGANPLPDLLAADPRMLAHLPAPRSRELLDAGSYVGDAPWRARELARAIREACAADER